MCAGIYLLLAIYCAYKKTNTSQFQHWTLSPRLWHHLSLCSEHKLTVNELSNINNGQRDLGVYCTEIVIHPNVHSL